jgi:hypothetical protein
MLWGAEKKAFKGKSTKAPLDRILPALRAPTDASPGQCPGIQSQAIELPPEVTQGPPPPFQGGEICQGQVTRGAALEWCRPRRWGGNVDLSFEPEEPA